MNSAKTLTGKIPGAGMRFHVCRIQKTFSQWKTGAPKLYCASFDFRS